MRVGAYTQIQQIYGAKKSAKPASTNKVSRRDGLEISSMGRDFQTAKKAVSEAADIREDITAPIKASVQNGTYSVSGESFAEKLMAKFNA